MDWKKLQILQPRSPSCLGATPPSNLSRSGQLWAARDGPTNFSIYGKDTAKSSWARKQIVEIPRADSVRSTTIAPKSLKILGAANLWSTPNEQASFEVTRKAKLWSGRVGAKCSTYLEKYQVCSIRIGKLPFASSRNDKIWSSRLGLKNFQASWKD